MGRPFIPAYGEVDLGSAIETAKGAIEQIETNKFDKEDLLALAKANNDIIIAIIQNEQ